jgi:hypothetical protein
VLVYWFDKAATMHRWAATSASTICLSSRTLETIVGRRRAAYDQPPETVAAGWRLHPSRRFI